MDTKERILQRKRAERAHARGLTEQVRQPEAMAEVTGDEKAGALDPDAIFAKWNAPRQAPRHG
jgi:hypothetical protein